MWQLAVVLCESVFITAATLHAHKSVYSLISGQWPCQLLTIGIRYTKHCQFVSYTATENVHCVILVTTLRLRLIFIL